MHKMGMKHRHTTYAADEMWKKMERLFDLFYHKLYVYAIGMLDDEDEAKDVVSNVMQTVWEDWNSPSPKMPDPTAAVLYTLVRNRALDMLRRQRVKEKYISMLNATSDFADDDEVLEFEERISDVNNAVERLPEKTRQVLLCTYYKKMSYKETSIQLGMSENMVRKHMIKAFRLLRDMLKIFILWYQFSILFVI